MNLQSNILWENLEFHKVIELLKKECLGEVAQVYFDRLPVDTETFMIEKKLREVSEYKQAIEDQERIPADQYQDIHPDLRMLEIADSVLSLESIQRIHRQLLITRELFAFFTPKRQEAYPTLFDILSRYTFDDELVKAIERVMDDEGELRPDASPELARIRRRMHSLIRERDKQFRSIIGELRQKGWLTDNEESFRNGRRVLSVPSEHKRKIRGIIHDESASGKTAFLEPEAILELNNDLFDLESEEKQEIFRILRELCNQIRPSLELIRQYQTLITRFDLVRAKANLALRMDAHQPKLKDGPHLGIKEGRHPLLFLKNKGLNRDTIPFDLTLFGANRLLVLSGPNAGGKTILMKSVGLLQLMTQAGLLIPADPDTEMGVFENIFVDIGDQQSLEDDLSTYSSHLKNMKTFLKEADDSSLILIDEFGSGTDPKIGGAIAESMLREFNRRRVYGLITTHYPNLKIFAYQTKGIVNGAMAFDKDSLSPTYQLQIGKPGSSYAFEIAEKSGLDKKLLGYARKRAGKATRAVDELLVDLQREKQELEESLEKATKREKHLDQLIQNYETLAKDLEFKRKKFKLEQKQKNLHQKAEENKMLERLVREIKEEKNLEKAKTLAAQVKKERKEVRQDVEQLSDEVYKQPKKQQQKRENIEVGSYVKVRDSGAVGQVQSIDRNKAIIQVGMLTMTAKLRDLEPSGEPLELNKSKGVNIPSPAQAGQVESKLDIRGMRKDEALKTLETFIDRAIVSSIGLLRIVHGKGNGVLREAVKKKLKEYPAFTEVYHPKAEQGGDGVTIASF